jgi:hypothetical protein
MIEKTAAETDPFPLPTKIIDAGVRVEKRTWKKVLVMSDAHIPYHDVAVLNLMYDFAKALDPDIVVLAGDWADCFAISPFLRSPERERRLSDEIRIVRANLRFLRQVLPDARIVYIDGNHEHRFRKYILKNADKLADLEMDGKKLTYENFLGLENFGIEHVATTPGPSFIDTYWQLEDGGTTYELLIGHFKRYSTHAGYAAKNLIDDYGISLIQAHTHCFGRHNRNMAHGTVCAWENGCLCDLHPDWTRAKHWCHAFAVVWFEKPGQFFQVEDIMIVNGQFRYGGELWRA